MENGKLRDTCLIKQNKQTEGQFTTAVLRQAWFRTSFDAFCVYLSSVLRIKCSGENRHLRQAPKR